MEPMSDAPRMGFGKKMNGEHVYEVPPEVFRAQVRDLRPDLTKLAALPGDYTVYPGHDRFSTLNFERQHNPYMKKL